MDSLNVAAASALRAALADRDYLAWYVGEVRDSRERFLAVTHRKSFDILRNDHMLTGRQFGQGRA